MLELLLGDRQTDTLYSNLSTNYCMGELVYFHYIADYIYDFSLQRVLVFIQLPS